ncbi:MAG: hypothetical protein RI911_237 [Candidatus Parcubacteria bacterium]|jgi:hypothetical protein
MIPAVTFVGACLCLYALVFLKQREDASGIRYAAQLRDRLDTYTAKFFHWLEVSASPEALWGYITHASTAFTHYCARAMARFAHVVEYRARTVVHKTSKRVRKEVHYLEEVIETKLDIGEKKGNNTASEK